jgi:hypothetical protein
MEETANSTKSSKKKNKKLIGIIVGVIILLLVVGGGLLVYKSHILGSSADESTDEIMDTSSLPTLQPEDIGMVVTLRKDNKAVMFELTKADDIKHVEYTIEYKAKTDEGIANQGILGEMNIAEDGITKTDFREFGTCSAGKCRYDNIVSDATITLKVTKKDGKSYQVVKVVKVPHGSEEEQ